jgi:hypothetical protein
MKPFREEGIVRYEIETRERKETLIGRHVPPSRSNSNWGHKRPIEIKGHPVSSEIASGGHVGYGTKSGEG